MKKIITAIFIFCFSCSHACEKCREDMLNYMEMMKYYKDHTPYEKWQTYMDGAINGINLCLDNYNINHPAE